MKPLTVFWIAWHPLCIAINIWSWTRTHEQLSLWCIAVLLLTFTYWINEGRKENRLRRDMQDLIKDMANQLIAHKKLIIAMNPQAEKFVSPLTKENE